MATNKELSSGLTAEWLRENMTYQPESGVFLWKRKGFGRRMGRILGTEMCDGYLMMKACGGTYYAHRLAWLYVYGEWPPMMIDHIDGNRRNNAIANLRSATPSQNSARRDMRKRTVGSSRGVVPQGPGFVARIHFDKKRHYLGYFSTAEAAKAAYEAKARELHGEFACEEKPVVVLMNDAGASSGILGFGA